ncbi:hypothetical protein CKA32_004676 [Geitlerinema sp. FC II]|nr:hypothetical protein CKA32_004676 [Geitlerinema sp. FC II]
MPSVRRRYDRRGTGRTAFAAVRRIFAPPMPLAAELLCQSLQGFHTRNHAR